MIDHAGRMMRRRTPDALRDDALLAIPASAEADYGDRLCGAKGDDFIVAAASVEAGATLGDWIFGQEGSDTIRTGGATTSSGEAEAPRTFRPASGTTSSTEAAGRTSSRVGASR